MFNLKIVYLFCISSIIFLFTSTSIYAQNKINADSYYFLNNTSPSLQNLIIDYHDKVTSAKTVTGIFDLYSFSDGSPENGPYKSSYQTKDGYEGAELQLIKYKAGTENIALIARQFGDKNSKVNTVTHDYILMARKRYFNGKLDIFLGLNYHQEPYYDIINNTKYFTNKNTVNSKRLISSIKIYNIGVNLLLNNDKEVEETILSYDFKTRYGIITPKVVNGFEPFKYQDTYLNYKINSSFKLNASMKYRQINDQELSKINQTGLVSKIVNIEKTILELIKLEAGYSSSNEFSSNQLNGYMYKIGIDFSPIFKSNNKDFSEDFNKAEFYFGISKNYAPILEEFQLIDQDINLFGVKFYW
jgi:hypothetical protein